MEIDISTGDEITPKELKYTYSSIFEDKEIFIDSYNIETILSEKIETVLRRGKYNTRMKDYYDIYSFLTTLKNEIDMNIFKEAFRTTIKKREAQEYVKDYEQILNEIMIDERMITYWNSYKAKNKYTRGIEFGAIIIELKEFLKKLGVS